MEKAPSNKTQVLTKSVNKGIRRSWCIKLYHISIFKKVKY